jgi:hypothetical protein
MKAHTTTMYRHKDHADTASILESLHTRLEFLETKGSGTGHFRARRMSEIEIMTRDFVLRSWGISLKYNRGSDSASASGYYINKIVPFSVTHNKATGLYTISSQTPALNFQSSNMSEVYSFLRNKLSPSGSSSTSPHPQVPSETEIELISENPVLKVEGISLHYNHINDSASGTAFYRGEFTPILVSRDMSTEEYTVTFMDHPALNMTTENASTLFRFLHGISKM